MKTGFGVIQTLLLSFCITASIDLKSCRMKY